jgi:hypothetical protein
MARTATTNRTIAMPLQREKRSEGSGITGSVLFLFVRFGMHLNAHNSRQFPTQQVHQMTLTD